MTNPASTLSIDNVQIVQDAKTYERILEFRRRKYSELYPGVDFTKPDMHDENSIILYTEYSDGSISSTARIGFEGRLGLPEEDVLRPLINQYRIRGRLAELGRFIIDSDFSSHATVKKYYKAFFILGLRNGVSSYLMLSRKKEIDFYEKRIGATVICEDTGLNFGSPHTFSAINWKLDDSKYKFLHWAGIVGEEKKHEIH